MIQEVAKSEARTAYNTWHAQQGLALECNDVWHQLIKANLDKIGGLAKKRVLEIGCGRGAFSHWMAARNPPPAEVVGADFSESAIELARQLVPSPGSARLTWETQDIQNIQHPPGSFDVVVSCETLEHVPEPRRAIAELYRILKPGGHMIVTHPNYLSPLGLYRAYVVLRGNVWRELGQPINHPLRVTQVRGWLKATGLSVEYFVGRGHFLMLPRRRPRELMWMQHPQWLMRWFGFHPLLIARKPTT